MSENTDNTSMEFHCSHLGADNVTANFTGKWSSWGKIDVNSVKPTMETVWAAFERAGLDFIPLTSPARWVNPLGASGQDENKKYVFNPAHDAPISLVGAEFNAMSHRETLTGIFGEVLEAGLIPARFISFERGARMLAQFAFPESLYAAGREHKAFASIANALDGRWSVKAGHTLWTPVCSNTFAASLRELANSARHTKNMAAKLPTIAKTLGIIREEVKTTLATLDAWGSKTVSAEMLKAFVAHLLPKKEESTSKAVDNRQNELLAAVYQTATELSDKGEITIYDLMAGTTRFVGGREGKRNGLDQYEYATTGPGGQLAQKAYNWLTENA